MGVQFFISHLARWLSTREPTFRPSGATKHWKNTVFCDFATFSRTCIFFFLTLSLLWFFFFFSSLLWLFPPLLFHLSILPEVWLLNFLRSYSQSGILPFEFYVHKVQYSINIARNWVKDCSASWDSTSCVHCFNMGVSWRRSVQTSQHFADLGHLGHLGTSESKVISIPGLYRLDNIYLD